MKQYRYIFKYMLLCPMFLSGCSVQNNELQNPAILTDQTIRIQGRMFSWDIHQAGPDQKLDTTDDITLENQIVVPVDSRVKLQLSSKDVLHGFFLPRLGLRFSIVPGPVLEKEVIVSKVGQYRFACSQVCGVGHGKMIGWLRVLSKGDYQHWLAQQGKEEKSN